MSYDIIFPRNRQKGRVSWVIWWWSRAGKWF